MSGIFQFAVRTQTELEGRMTSVERVSHYCKVVPRSIPRISGDLFQTIESEGEWHADTDASLTQHWPHNGALHFQNVKSVFPFFITVCLRLRYRPNQPVTLNDVTFSIGAREKLAIIGRTGSGELATRVVHRLLQARALW